MQPAGHLSVCLPWWTEHENPQIHKPNNPGRPIISACSCPTELISSFLDKKMAPFFKSLPTYIKDTNHTLNILKQFSFPGNNKFLFTMDITSLYTGYSEQWKGFWHLNTFSTNAPSKNPQPTHCFVWLNLSWHLTVSHFPEKSLSSLTV